MVTENLEYLDESGLNRTAANVLAKIAESKAQIEAELDSLSYAKPNGIYPEMTVGAVMGADETAQWAQRESTGTGSATVRSVQGAAVVWNQMLIPWNGVGLGLTFAADGSKQTVRGTATTTSNTRTSSAEVVVGHKYLVIAKAQEIANAAIRYYRNSAYITGEITDTSSWAAGDRIGVGIYYENGAEVSASYYPQLFDLTQMFGAGNEPTTVAEFERMYPEAYYPYSAPTLKPVQISGIRSTDAQGGELDSVEWTTQTLRAAGIVRDALYSAALERRVGVVDLGTLTWFRNEITAGSGVYAFENDALTEPFSVATTNLKTALYPCVGNSRMALLNTDKAMTPWNNTTTANIGIRDDAYSTAADFKAAMNGVLLFYELATPTTTPISPALPMTYKVQANGSESIIVPSGEISAAPIITVAEPVNMSTELARIWAAIEALQGSRQALQSDVRNDMQEITTDLTPIDVTKEVQQTDENREVSE